MKTENKNAVISAVVTAAFAIGLLLTGAGIGDSKPAFAGGPYMGRVVDSETGRPLEGAVVLAVWELEVPLPAGTAHEFLDAEEVLTDGEGRFAVGRNALRGLNPWKVGGPDLTIYYPGYGFYPRYHVSPKIPIFGGTPEIVKRMEKEEVTIELPSLKTREDRIRVLGGVIRHSVPDEKMPNLLRLLNLERKRLGFAPTHTN